MEIKGSVVAVVTPFNNDSEQSVNYDKLSELVELHIKSGTSAIVPCGTTGETPTLTKAEWEKVVATTIQVAKGSGVKVIPGTGSYSTAETVKTTAMAAEMGADGCLVVAPYYNKPTPAGLLRHFKAVDAVGLPIMLYNIPGRTGINISPETTEQLFAECKNMVAIKAANGNLDEMTEVLVRVPRAIVLSGDDGLTIPIMSIGGTGVVSVVANILPSVMAELCSCFERGEVSKAAKIQRTLHPFIKVLFAGGNPPGIKCAMNVAGMNVGGVRSPLADLGKDQEDKMLNVIRQMRLDLAQCGVNVDSCVSSI